MGERKKLYPYSSVTTRVRHMLSHRGEETWTSVCGLFWGPFETFSGDHYVVHGTPKERQRIHLPVNIQPHIFDGVPWCSTTNCPSYKLLSFGPVCTMGGDLAGPCEPAVCTVEWVVHHEPPRPTVITMGTETSTGEDRLAPVSWRVDMDATEGHVVYGYLAPDHEIVPPLCTNHTPRSSDRGSQ